MKFLFVLIFSVFAANSYATTTVILEDGTVIETTDKVYISDQQLYKFEEAAPVAESELEVGSEEWCEWFVESNNGNIEPSFDDDYQVYIKNCD